MARHMTRSTETQVVPDVSLDRRLLPRVGVGGPGKDPGPLYGSKEHGPSVFTRVGPLRVIGFPKQSSPQIEWKIPIHVPGTNREATKTALFSATSKMDCPSFSLPAGPTTEGGSCAAANRAITGAGLREAGRLYICDGCYSQEGNYWQADVTLSQAARFHWVLARLNADRTGEALAQDLIAMIVDVARFCTLSNARDGLAIRLKWEIGVWTRGRIHIPVPTGRTLRYQEGGSTPLVPETGARDSQEWIAKNLSPAEGDIAGFFRIHDSGDFTLGSPEIWPRYVAAWARVAQALPKVLFWAPTRAWVLPSLVKAFAEARRSAPNLVLRPSALHLHDEPPQVPGLDAGTMVTDKAPKGKVPRLPGASTACPVYIHAWDPLAFPRAPKRLQAGEMGEWVSPQSCRAAGCRRCWIDPITQVAYGYH